MCWSSGGTAGKKTARELELDAESDPTRLGLEKLKKEEVLLSDFSYRTLPLPCTPNLRFLLKFLKLTSLIYLPRQQTTQVLFLL